MFKVIDFGTNRKHVCDFLLVRHSNIGPILHRFRDIAGYLLRNWPHPYSTRILRVFPLHQISHVGFFRAKTLSQSAMKLFLKYSNLCEIHTWTLQTDRRKDGRLSITALCV